MAWIADDPATRLIALLAEEPREEPAFGAALDPPAVAAALIRVVETIGRLALGRGGDPVGMDVNPTLAVSDAAIVSDAVYSSA